MEKKRTNRRLGVVSLLPSEADPVIKAAIDAIRARRMSLTDIHRAFNAGLEQLGLKPISFSAFHRWSLSIDPREPVAVTSTSRAPFPVMLGDDTRRLLAAALRAIAADLMLHVPAQE